LVWWVLLVHCTPRAVKTSLDTGGCAGSGWSELIFEPPLAYGKGRGAACNSLEAVKKGSVGA
jgi:hypothetical protein